MALKLEITCDGCQKDITATGNCVDYRIAMKVERLPTKSGTGFVTAMMIYPPLKNDAYFCGINCVRIWMDKNHPAREADAA